MFKLLILLVGIAIGFGGGVWWGVKNPEQAATISAEEERRFVEAQLKITQAMKDKLDQLASRKSKAPGSGFLSSSGEPDPAVSELRDQQDKQLRELQNHLDKLSKK